MSVWLEIFVTRKGELGMMIQVCNPALQRLRQEDCKFQASLGYIKKTKM
jgi:hypothetical protein